ncbi:aminopeptidase P family protein [Bacillus horti]|uniref:Xaa-Pro aminopeptidase n=2 Tax=Caldalkalibacillus horti TaxID=77523 RepID=A0ABT9W2L2_9BACI|nr:Xaa-Pro aminopeptidase [Bacillus horti]
MVVRKDIELKVSKVRKLFLDEKNYAAVYLQRRDHFSWLTSGGYNGVAYNTMKGECGILVTENRFCLVTNTIEKRRILEEELYDLPVDIMEYSWFESLEDALRKAVPNGRIASDHTSSCTVDETEALNQLRYSLTSLELERYLYFGELATDILESFCMGIKPGQSERDIAAGLNQAYLSAGLTPTVTLVGCDDRIDIYRHPIATAKIFTEKCMVVSCVSYKGLIVALTRMIYVKNPCEAKERFKHTARIDAEMITATQAGASTKALFEQVKVLYAEAGYADEWRLHHQGGAIGYQNRDYLITPTSTETIQLNQAFAWNPSIQGTKSEDTILTSESGPEIITCSQSGWPRINVVLSSGCKLSRPDIYTLD